MKSARIYGAHGPRRAASLGAEPEAGEYNKGVLLPQHSPVISQ